MTLRRNLGIRGVKKVSMHEPLTNLRKVIAVVVERGMPATEVWRALYGAASWNRAVGKFVIAINEDIDLDNADAQFWAMSYRANNGVDIQILNHRDPGHGARCGRGTGGRPGKPRRDRDLERTGILGRAADLQEACRHRRRARTRREDGGCRWECARCPASSHRPA